MRRTHLALVGPLVLSLCCIRALSGGDYNGFEVRGALVPADQILRGGPLRDGIPAIDDPKFVDAEKARSQYPDGTQGVAVRSKGETKAYPISILNWHEIVNDTIGITYCPPCETGIVFRAKEKGETVSFGVSGLALSA